MLQVIPKVAQILRTAGGAGVRQTSATMFTKAGSWPSQERSRVSGPTLPPTRETRDVHAAGSRRPSP